MYGNKYYARRRLLNSATGLLWSLLTKGLVIVGLVLLVLWCLPWMRELARTILN